MLHRNGFPLEAMFSTLGLIHIIIVSAGLSFFTHVRSDSLTYAKCYNTTSEMHCFNTTFENLENFSDAQKHCAQINATLLVIKNEEVQNVVERFISESNPSSDLTFVWTSAYLDINKTWHWLNCTVPLPSGFNPTTNLLQGDVACLEFQRTDNSSFQFIPLESYTALSYICQCSESGFGSEAAKVLHHNGTYYVASDENVTWYEARNICFKEKCDLASFRNLSSINLTNWINTTPGKRYWIGLRQGEWNWNTSGETSQVLFTHWWKNYPSVPDRRCMFIQKEIDGAYTWRPLNCNNRPRTYAVCQRVTPLKLENNTAIYSGSKCSTSSSTVSIAASATTYSFVAAPTREFDSDVGVRVGVGVGIGVGVPLLIGLLIVIIIVLSKRKRLIFPMQ